MARTTSRRLRTGTITKQVIDQASTLLEELPEKPKNLSLREAVDQLQDQIKTALAKGYSHSDVATMLTARGIEISATTLKKYVPSGRNQRKRKGSAKLPAKQTGKSSVSSEELEAAFSGASSSSSDVATASETADTPKIGRRRGRTPSAAKSQPAKTTTAAKTKPANGRRSRAASTAESAPTRSAKPTTRSSTGRGRKKGTA